MRRDFWHMFDHGTRSQCLRLSFEMSAEIGIGLLMDPEEVAYPKLWIKWALQSSTRRVGETYHLLFV